MAHAFPLLFLVLLFCTCHAAYAQEWRLAWSDEFDGPADSPPDPAKWRYDLGGGGWGNRELETYTNSTANVFLDGAGHVVIRAVRTESGGYTSARLKTQDRFTTTYGKIEARIKIPSGEGMWPAFWALGANIADRSVGWPRCGEIDIMENIGKEPSIVHGTIHGPGYSGAHGIGAPFTLAGGHPFSEDFHVFGVIWQPESVEFFVDGESYEKIESTTIPAGTKWVFNTPFFLLLNVAVGGSWPGNPTAATRFPQEMTVDYVRVYRRVAAGQR